MADQVRNAEGERREREIAALARKQHGVISRSQLLATGIAERSLERWLSIGRRHHLHREAFAVGPARLSRWGHWSAAVLAYGEGALLSHLTAASLWGLAGARGPVDVTASLGRQGVRRRPGIRLHPCRIDSEDRDEHNGIPLTSVARTLFDLAEVVDYEKLRRATQEADRLKLLRLSEMERVVERGRGRRALRPTRRLLSDLRAPTITRSPLEDRFHDFCEAHRLPPPAANVLVLGREVDALWPDAKLVVELDSWEFHASRAAFQRDRRLDSERLAAGYRTARVTHHRLDHEAATLLAELRALLAVALE